MTKFTQTKNQKKGTSKANNRRRIPRAPRRRTAPRKLTRKVPRRATSRGSSLISTLAHLTLDPCGAQVTAGVHGTVEGTPARVKSTITLPNLIAQSPESSALDTCGYILWCPDFTNAGRDSESVDAPYPQIANSGNLYLWTSPDPNIHPVNVTGSPLGLTPYGGGQVHHTAVCLTDPAFPLANTTLVADSRPLAACIQMTFTGPLVYNSGEIGYLDNVTAQELIGYASNGVDHLPISPNELMNFCNKKERLSQDTHEITYRLNSESSGSFRRTPDPNLTTNLQLQQGDLIFRPQDVDDANTPLTAIDVNKSTLRFFGLVWRGVQPDSTFTLDMTKVIEWRAHSIVGLTQVPLRSVGPSLVPAVSQVVDKINAHVGTDVTKRTMGPGSTIVNQMGSSLGNFALSGAKAAGASVFKTFADEAVTWLGANAGGLAMDALLLL